ncbi:MAG: hypothetical protein V7636_1605 [Actinomycetota bacterium]|jgi:hypothetical protein
MRRIALFLAVVGGAIGLTALPAFAGSYCVEVSTPNGGTATVCVPE